MNEEKSDMADTIIVGDRVKITDPTYWAEEGLSPDTLGTVVNMGEPPNAPSFLSSYFASASIWVQWDGIDYSDTIYQLPGAGQVYDFLRPEELEVVERG